jgi:hypothetical protein
MKKLTILLTMLMATSAWAEVVEKKLNGTLLVCESGKSNKYNYKARKFTIKKLLQGKVKLPKEKKLINEIKRNGASRVINRLELNGLSVIYVDSNKEADIDEDAKISRNSITGDYKINSFEPSGSKEIWNTQTSHYEKIDTPGSCDSDYWYRKQTLEIITPNLQPYERSFPSYGDMDRWETLGRKSLVHKRYSGCYRDGDSYIQYRYPSQCYVADRNKVIEINNALYNLKSIIKTYANEVSEDREKKRKESLKDNEI